LYIGANAKLISSNLETYNSFGGAVDIVLYIDERNDVNWEVIRNIGTQFTTYSGTTENCLLEIMFGLKN
jgi:hypothetical protein